MRHLKRGRKLNRTSSHRKAMVRNMIISLLEHGRIETTPAKAKEARPFAERLITIAKGGTLAHRRRAIAALNDKKIVARLFEDIAPRYANRKGGYCRILHLDKHRIGDAAPLCLFELVEEEVRAKGAQKKRAKAKVKSPAVGTKPTTAKEKPPEKAAEAPVKREAPKPRTKRTPAKDTEKPARKKAK
ncbi:MAG: 50S ribosomal protein L17 [Planctomycetota bacterium]